LKQELYGGQKHVDEMFNLTLLPFSKPPSLVIFGSLLMYNIHDSNPSGINMRKLK
jgi:hypothetical protein